MYEMVAQLPFLNLKDSSILQNLLQADELRGKYRVASPEKSRLSSNTSLYGGVHVLECITTGSLVVVKLSSHTDLLTQSSSSYPSAKGVVLPENVRRESALMCKLLQCPSYIDKKTCGLHDKDNVHHTTLAAASKCVSQYVHSFEYRGVHVLMCQYHNGGDLLSIIARFVRPADKASGVRASYTMPLYVKRELALHMVLSVFYLHSQSIAHLDVSVENWVFDGNLAAFFANPKQLPSVGCLKLIDLGVAMRHHLYQNHPESPRELAACDTPPWAQLVSPKPQLPGAASHRFSFGETSSSSSDNKSPAGHDKFMCHPVRDFLPSNGCKPGKPGNMLTELLTNEMWDAYAADCFSLGTALYYLYFGCRLNTNPDPKNEYFHSIRNGEWLENMTPQNTHPEELAFLQLIDVLIKPQSRMSKVDQLIDMDVFSNKTTPS